MQNRVFIIGFAMLLSVSTATFSYSANNNNNNNVEKEEIQLALKIAKLKDKYGLDYVDEKDLRETCRLIIKHTKGKEFDRYDVAAIILKESRFKKNAYNRKDGGKGLGQITGLERGWHRGVLDFITNPFNKDQNIQGIVVRLEENKKIYKTKALAIKRYNGSTNKSVKYQQSIYKLKKEIETVII